MDVLADHVCIWQNRTCDRYSHIGRYGTFTMRANQPYPALMLTARITWPHFSVSSAMNLPNSTGDSANTVPPKSASRAFNWGSARPALISLLSLSMTSTGVSFGAPTPYHALTS